jgi:putative transposase
VRRKRSSVEQMVAVLKQAEVGVPVAEVCRQAGITEQTFYRRKKRYVGLDIDQVRQLKQLQEENARPGQDHVAGCAVKKIVKPSRRRPVVSYLRGVYQVSQERACGTRASASPGRRCGSAYGKLPKPGCATVTGRIRVRGPAHRGRRA